MKTTDALSLLEEAIQKAAADGVQSVELAALKEYVTQLRKVHEDDERLGFDSARLEKFRSDLAASLEHRKETHAFTLEMFRSVIQAGQGALRACLLINGGAAVALLAFTGHIVSSDLPVVVPLREVANAMGAYVGGVLAGGVASGTTYLSQWFYADDWNKTGMGFNVASIVLGLGSIALFGFGSYLAYQFFVAL